MDISRALCIGFIDYEYHLTVNKIKLKIMSGFLLKQDE